MPRSRPAFALCETLAIVLIAGLVLVMLVVAGDSTRRQARVGDDMANLRQIGAVTADYAADNLGLFWSFSWKKNQQNSKYFDLNNAGTDLQAAADQAVDILRRHGREDMPKISGWLANLTYSQLVLADYMSMKLPDRLFISSGDANRLLWAGDPFGFDTGKFGNKQPPPNDGTSKRWPYSASYQLTPIFWSSPTSGGDAMYQGPVHNQYYIPGNTQFGACNTAEIAHPSQKVQMHDSWAWHFGERHPYYGLAEARLPLLFCDGSVSVRATGDAGPGWIPVLPNSPEPSIFPYQPSFWEPPTTNGEPSELVTGYYRWTRQAREGRDFGGPETKP